MSRYLKRCGVSVQGAHLPPVHRAGVQSLRRDLRSAEQPGQRLQRARAAGAPLAQAGPDPAVLRDWLPPSLCQICTVQIYRWPIEVTTAGVDGEKWDAGFFSPFVLKKNGLLYVSIVNLNTLPFLSSPLSQRAALGCFSPSSCPRLFHVLCVVLFFLYSEVQLHKAQLHRIKRFSLFPLYG